MPTAGPSLSQALTMVAVLAFPASAFAQEQKPVDLTGKWAFTVSTDAGTGTPTVTLTQKGDTLTGHYSSLTLGEASLTGMVKGNTITFAVSVSVQGTSFTVTYTGTIEGADSLKGSVDLGGMSSGTFTAKRLP